MKFCLSAQERLSLLHKGLIKELKQQRRRRLRKRHLKMNSHFLKLYRAYSISFNSSNVGKFFWSWILKDCIKVQEKKKKVVVLCSHASTKREIRHFHVVIVQRRLRNVQKCVMHVQSCCFANINLLVFCRSRCRRCRRRCLSSLMVSYREAGQMDYYFCWNTQWEPPGRRGTGLFSKRNSVVCCHGVGAKEWEWTQSFVWRVEIWTIRWM